MEFLNYDFDWSVLWREPFGQMMTHGILTTVHLSLLAWTIALLLGCLIGVLRTQSWMPGRFAGAVYVQVFRNTPFLVHLFFWYYAAPLILSESAQQLLYDCVPDYAYWAGVVGLGTYTASRVAEQFRAGFSSIPRDQYRAAYASGLRTVQVYRWIIIPYGLRLVLPTITTEFLTCFKNSALTMTIGVMETTHTAYYVDSFTWHGLETTTAASLVYLFISWTVIAIMGQIEKYVRIPGQIRQAR